MQINKKKAAIIAAAVILIASTATVVYTFRPGPKNNHFPDAEFNPETIQSVKMEFLSSRVPFCNSEFTVTSKKSINLLILCLKDLSTVSDKQFTDLQESANLYGITYKFKDGTTKYYKHAIKGVSYKQSLKRFFEAEGTIRQIDTIFQYKTSDIKKAIITVSDTKSKIEITDPSKLAVLLDSVQKKALKPYDNDEDVKGNIGFYNRRNKPIYGLCFGKGMPNYQEICKMMNS